ncbi:MAG: hypothetical protein ACREIC_33205 [Limisphaerales bacterium]
MKKLVFAFATVALAAASAASNSFNLTIYQPTWVEGTQLKPGDYKVQMQGDKAVIKSGKNAIEVPVKVETAGQKYNSTAIRVDSNQKLEEIRVGGTSTRILFPAAASAAAE